MIHGLQALPAVVAERLGDWQGVVENLVKIGTAASEVSHDHVLFDDTSPIKVLQLHPVAKAVFGTVNVFYQVFVFVTARWELY
jgi:hypothetical protein